MPNVYVEPLPKAREGAIQGYALEFSSHQRVTPNDYRTQEEAIKAAKNMGHHPLVARVRHTDKGNPDHWRAA
ncbi:hypothetical protein B0G62_13234 [Paraburkholderia eburnea]|uniref:Uncharacterized protein n=1 Tax=Paraburkholderia eburnea TaxID=1189126 RepID=A0A2S4LSY4_9BURK|nr:hypothetical protein [Paraburkholderia eburnea]POR45528.1 hypothetical protein B0G62_13234 [Paraburkholderia eburnea]PRZ13796.1 hypothetical protein BX588_13035 [Paraburkholderia eburnea]